MAYYYITDIKFKKKSLQCQSFKHVTVFTLWQAIGFGDGKSICRALVSTWVQGDAACLVFNIAVLSCNAGALQWDICHPAA